MHVYNNRDDWRDAESPPYSPQSHRFLPRRALHLIPFIMVTTVMLVSSGIHAVEVRLAPSPGADRDSQRWLDAACNAYSSSFRKNYSYADADVRLYFDRTAPVLRVRIIGTNLKPNFAYQVKIEGIPGTDSGERIGLTGRWWQEEWDGAEWAWGWNLNNKGDGTSPNPNDEAYFARKDEPDPASPTGLHYRFTPYLLFGYFITDASGAVDAEFVANNSYHVLWLTSQRAHTADDGPVVEAEIAPSALSDAYDDDAPLQVVSLFGEWERLPHDGVFLPPGEYSARFLLTEESFHGLGGDLAGFWATAMEAPIEFTIGTAPVFTTQPEDSVAAIGDRVVLSATVEADPAPSFTWTHNGEVVPGATDSELVLDPLTETDAGEYVCTASNIAGSASSRIVRVGVMTADEDGDRMDDQWEIQCFGNLDHAPETDDDGDGFSNYAEFLRGMDAGRYVLTLHSGWNLISLGCVPDDNSVETLFAPASDVVRFPVWEWTPDGYRAAREISPLQGYWVYCTSESDVEIEIPAPAAERSPAR